MKHVDVTDSSFRSQRLHLNIWIPFWSYFSGSGKKWTNFKKSNLIKRKWLLLSREKLRDKNPFKRVNYQNQILSTLIASNKWSKLVLLSYHQLKIKKMLQRWKILLSIMTNSMWRFLILNLIAYNQYIKMNKILPQHPNNKITILLMP